MDGLNALAWMQTSAEYRGTALQAWRAAGAALPRALKDKRWTAALEQTGDFRKLKPAIVVDIDETILDNSPGQARFLLEGNGRFDAKLWGQWTSEHRARAIAGAKEFLSEARRRGVTVFYLSNRGVKEEAGTRANLEAEGFPVVTAAGDLGDTVMLYGEKPEWTADKGVRRAAIAKYYRILLLCGDDLNDFIPARVSREERAAKAGPYDGWWGERWIVLANPMYGSWEDALLGYRRDQTGAEAAAAKMKALRRE